MKQILNILTGTVNVLIEGFFVDKVINTCKYKLIELSEIKKETDCIMHVTIKVKDYKKIAKICKKAKCRIKILKKQGLPFILHRYRKRKIFAVISVIMIMLIIMLNQFIYKIEINTENIELANKVSNQLKNIGIKKYCLKNIIEFNEVKNLLMLNIEELSWIELNISGAILTVDLQEKDKMPNIINAKQPCDIVASKDGLIEQIIVEKGLRNVVSGQVVSKGDVLISGEIISERIDPWQVHAAGQVYAKVWYSQNIDVKFYEENSYYTGNQKNIYGVKVSKNHKVFWGKVSTNFKEYDTIMNENNLVIYKLFLPIKICQIQFNEKQSIVINRNYEEAIIFGIQEIEKKMQTVIPPNTKINDIKKNVKDIEGGINLEVIYESIEQIGVEQKIK